MKTKETTIGGLGVNLIKQCPECGRVFDMLNPIDAEEWAYGHDCEETTTTKIKTKTFMILITEKNKMTIEQAKRITGNQPRWALVNMVRALSMMSILNTEEENERLEAAKFLLGKRN